MLSVGFADADVAAFHVLNDVGLNLWHDALETWVCRGDIGQSVNICLPDGADSCRRR
jgi:hypothetical protein